MEKYIQVNELTHSYGEEPLFAPLSFDLSAGTILQVTGKNGSGKTTLLQLLAKIKTCQAGSIHWNEAVTCQYIGHKNAIKGELSPLENLSLYHPSKARCIQALEDIGLESRYHLQPCYTLSAGQQRKAALSRLLLGDEKVWILDEPFTALDSASKALLNKYLERHANDGGSAVIATHELINLDKSLIKNLGWA